MASYVLHKKNEKLRFYCEIFFLLDTSAHIFHEILPVYMLYHKRHSRIYFINFEDSRLPENEIRTCAVKRKTTIVLYSICIRKDAIIAIGILPKYTLWPLYCTPIPVYPLSRPFSLHFLFYVSSKKKE